MTARLVVITKTPLIRSWHFFWVWTCDEMIIMGEVCSPSDSIQLNIFYVKRLIPLNSKNLSLLK